MRCGSTQPPIQWTPGVSRGYSSQSVALTTHPKVKERVGLYFCSSSAFVACSRVNFTFTFTFTPVYHVTLFTRELFLQPLPKILGAVHLRCLQFLKRKFCDTHYCQIWKMTKQRVGWSGTRTPSGAMIFHRNAQTVSGTHPAYSYSFLGLKRLRPEVNPYPTAFPYGNGMVLHFYQQQESSTTKTVHKVINKRLKTYV